MKKVVVSLDQKHVKMLSKLAVEEYGQNKGAKARIVEKSIELMEKLKTARATGN